MKKIVMLFMMLICVIGLKSQDIDSTFFEKNEIVNVDSISKNLLYFTAQSWFAEYFKNSKSVIEISDKEQGKIFGKGSFKISNSHGFVKFNITILVKDGKYKYILSDFTSVDVPYVSAMGHTPGNTYYDLGSLTQVLPKMNYMFSSHNKKCWKEIKTETNNDIIDLISNLKNYMSKGNIKQKETW